MSEGGPSSDKNTPRRWTIEEDELLVQLLMEMNTNVKWKAKGGFRSGYLAHLEKLFAEKMPEAGLKSFNIDSRLGYLKKKFNALLEIKQKGSGFSWDDSLKMVTGDRKLFEEWAKSHKDAKGLFRKSFPLFDDLEEIYAKDRATGLKSAMPADRDNIQDNIHDNIQDNIQDATLNQEAKSNQEATSNQDAKSNQDGEVRTEISGNTKRTADEDSSSKKPNKKRLWRNKEIENVLKSFGAMMERMLESSNAQIEKLVTLFEAPKHVKVGLREDLGKVAGISRAQALSLCVKMTEDEVVIFRDLKDNDEKYDFLTMILEK